MTTHRHFLQPSISDEKTSWDELEQQPISFDLALALRHHIETVRRDAENGNGKINDDIGRAKSRAAADFLLAALTKLTTPIADE